MTSNTADLHDQRPDGVARRGRLRRHDIAAPVLRVVRLVVAAQLGMAALPAAAVPSFAAQTGQPCTACHVGGFGPQLTAFGRSFKIGGYTNRAVAFNVPISAQVVASYLHTRLDQSAPPTPDFHVNNNLALDQIGLFLAGGLGNHFGGFAQVTYDGVGKAWSWDNLDLRAVTTTTIAGKDAVVGFSLNNSPATQDPWNTLPAWGFPYTGSAIAPSPAAAPLFVGGLAQNVLGLTAYAWLDSKFYVEAGGYRTPTTGTLRWLGADPYSPGDILGVAPYVRLAYQRSLGGGDVEVGAFLLRASLHPGRDTTTGTRDRYSDIGADASYILPRANGDVATLNARYIHESSQLDASYALGNTSFASGTMNDWRIDASYYWRNAIGATVGWFDTSGSIDPLRFGGRTGRPDSSGFLLQLDGTPFGEGSPVGRWFNVRMGVQYTIYTRFDGAGTDFDGLGTNASANNTLRIFTWLAF